MAADLGNLESLRINDPREEEPQPEATLASMPEDLWRRIAAYVAPRDSARNLLVASGRSSSLRGALLADIERTERALYGLALTADEYDSRVLARVVSERTRERFRNAINAGLAVVRAAAINAGLDAEALAESVDAQITEAINRNVAETISDLTGDAAEAQ